MNVENDHGDFEVMEEEDHSYDNLIEKKENESLFSPEKGNVAFASAIDCWAFNLTGFSRILAQKFGMNARVL